MIYPFANHQVNGSKEVYAELAQHLHPADIFSYYIPLSGGILGNAILGYSHYGGPQ